MMTEEERRLKGGVSFGQLLVAALILLVGLALFGLVFPGDVLPQSTTVLLVVVLVGIPAIVIAVLMRRRVKRDVQDAEDSAADALLRRGFDTMADKHDEAARLAALYDQEEGS